MLTPYQDLSDARSRVLLARFGEPILIKGEIHCPNIYINNELQPHGGIFTYPTEAVVLARAGGTLQRSSLRAEMRIPEMVLHKSAGEFKKGDPVRILCRYGSPNFIIDEIEYTEAYLYRVLLVEEQAKPVDTNERGWR